MSFIGAVLAEIFKSKTDMSSVISKSTEQIKESLRADAFSIAIRIFCGLIATSVIIYSLITIGQQLNIILLALDDGPFWSMGFFALVLLLGSIVLYYLFKPTANRIPVQAPEFPHKDFDFMKIINAFIAGIEKGSHHASANKHTESKPVEEMGVSGRP